MQQGHVADTAGGAVRQFTISMRLREKVGMLFVHLNRFLGRFRLRGTCDANDEVLLAAITQNLCKLVNIFPAPQ